MAGLAYIDDVPTLCGDCRLDSVTDCSDDRCMKPICQDHAIPCDGESCFESGRLFCSSCLIAYEELKLCRECLDNVAIPESTVEMVAA